MTLLSAAWRRRVLIIVPALLMPFVALFASIILPRNYEARTTLLVQEPSKLNPFLNDLAIGPNVKDRIQALDALLHSENVLDQVLRDVGLVSDKTGADDRYQMIQRLKLSTKVSLIGNDLIEIKVSDRQPGNLLPILIAVTRRFVDRLLSPEQSAIVDSQTFLDSQLGSRRARARKGGARLFAVQDPSCGQAAGDLCSQCDAPRRAAAEARGAEHGSCRRRRRL